MFTRMPWVVPKPPLLMVGMLSEALNKLQPGLSLNINLEQAFALEQMD